MNNRQNSRILRYVFARNWFSENAKKLRLAMGHFQIAIPPFEVWRLYKDGILIINCASQMRHGPTSPLGPTEETSLLRKYLSQKELLPATLRRRPLPDISCSNCLVPSRNTSRSSEDSITEAEKFARGKTTGFAKQLLQKFFFRFIHAQRGESTERPPS